MMKTNRFARMSRRNFAACFPLLTGAATLLPHWTATSPVRKSFVRSVATSVEYPAVLFPEDKRMPLGLQAFPVPTAPDASSVVRLHFPKTPSSSAPWYVRLTAAIDFREEKTVSLYLPQSGQEIGTLDIRYAHPFQAFQTAIDARWLSDIQQQGLALRMTRGTQTAWFLLPEALPPDARGLAPQLLAGEAADEKTFWQTFYSMNSFSPFGWMGGCVQDALYELHQQGDKQASATLKTQLNYYFDEEQNITFESPHTRPLIDAFHSIEDFLPFAAIAGLYPEHPAVQKAVDFCLARRNAQGIIMSGDHLTTEGCYTVAYPLATIAQARQDPALAQIALDQLRYRTQYLVETSAVYQRTTLAGDQSYRNWGRGVAWYLLGTIKTLAVLQKSRFTLFGTEEVQHTWIATAQQALSWRNPDHLWYAYLDRPDTGVDTSPSAGIAAAIAWGIHLGLLFSPTRRELNVTYRSLQHYLTPDGFLTQVAQINRGGEDLQANGYRVISQFGMGLMAQLKAAIEV